MVFNEQTSCALGDALIEGSHWGRLLNARVYWTCRHIIERRWFRVRLRIRGLMWMLIATRGLVATRIGWWVHHLEPDAMVKLVSDVDGNELPRAARFQSAGPT